MRAVSLVVCVALVGHAAANIISKKYQPKMETIMMQSSDYVDQYPTKYQMQDQFQPQYQMQIPSQYQIQKEQKYQMQNEKYQPQYPMQNEKFQQQYPMQYEKYQKQMENEKYQPQYQIQNEKFQAQYPMQYEKYQKQMENEKYQPQYQIQNEKYDPQYQILNEKYQQQYMTEKDQKTQSTKTQKQKSIRTKKQRKPVDSEEIMADDVRGWMQPMPAIVPRSLPVAAQQWEAPAAQQWEAPATQQWDALAAAQQWDAPMFAAVPRIVVPSPEHGDAIAWRDIQIADGPNSPITDKKEIERIFEDAYQTMTHLTEADKHAVHTAFETAAHDHSAFLEAQMNATELIRSHGFTVEEHEVRTDDGYILTVMRMSSGKEASEPRGVVLLMPGLLGAAEDWLLLGPQHALAYRLAAAGRDVWLGAFRGGRYGKKHSALNPAQDEFWHFSIDDLALRDVPAIIDHVLQETKQPALHYVAHSLGVTAALELLATQPAYNAKVAGVYALAPIMYTSAARSPMLRMLAPTSPFSELLTAQLGDAQFLPPRALLLSTGGALLQAELGCSNVSGNARLVMNGARMEDAEAAAALALAVRSADATSARVVRQLAAAAAARQFARYDHGARVNRGVYGAAAAPAVQVSRVSAPVLLLPAAADWLAAPADVARLAADLPRATSAAVDAPHATAMDLLFSAHTADLVNDIVMRAIDEAVVSQTSA